MARSENEALKELWRDYFDMNGHVGRKTYGKLRLGADGDELLNRRMTAEGLLGLAQNSVAPESLRQQMLVAAWWRGELVGDQKVAVAAARLVRENIPMLRDAAEHYLNAGNAEQRQIVLVKTALRQYISPVVGRIAPASFAEYRKKASANWWCSFDNRYFSAQKSIERISEKLPSFQSDPGKLSIELKKLEQLGTGADWLARIALALVEKNPASPEVRPMFLAVVASEKAECMGPDSTSLISAAKNILARNNNISEEELRAEYDRLNAQLGKWEYRVSHILVPDELQAIAAMKAIDSGTSFEEVVRRYTIDKSTRQNGGDLGWVVPANFVEPFALALKTSNGAGLLPQPVKTRFGWHVIRVRGIRPLAAPPFDAVRTRIEENLRKRRDAE